MGRSSKITGDRGEDLAVSYLKKKGYKILKRNFRFERGEIDIVALDGKTLVFAEVKTATTLIMGPPESWVTAVKQKRLGKVAQKFLYDFNDDTIECRFDVVAITLQQNRPHINHIENAFWLQDE